MQMSSNVSINTKNFCPNLKKNFFLRLVFVIPVAICRRYQQRWWKWWKNLPPVSLIPVVHLDSRISPRIFRTNSKRSKRNTLGLGGNWFMKKTRSKKSRDTVPLSEYERRTRSPPLSGTNYCGAEGLVAVKRPGERSYLGRKRRHRGGQGGR